MELPLVDMEKLLVRMEDDRELIREIFEVFIEEYPERRSKFERALSGDDTKTMVLLAHSLKGASGTLHAEPLRQLCFELEHASRTGDSARIASFTPLVLDMLDKTAKAMEELKARL